MDYEFEPIILRYEGLEADQHVIDLAQVGQSLQGAAHLLGSAGHLVVTGHYAKRSHALAVRVLASEPRAACWELPAVIMTIAPAAIPIFPAIADIGKKAATVAVTKVVNYALKKMAGSKSEIEMALGLAEKALVEMGQTSRHAMDAVERIATNQRPAAKLYVMPIGQSCARARIGNPEDGAVLIDKAMRDAITAPEQIEVGPATTFHIIISELDLKNRSCKFLMVGEPQVDDEQRRVNGEITDPQLHSPHNPYSEALASQHPIAVIAKPQFKEDEIEKLYISDIASLTPLVATR